MVEQNAIKEAHRYVANAKQTLAEKAELNIKTGIYQDTKYISSAGHYLWHACLIAIDEALGIKHAKKLTKSDSARIQIKDYELKCKNTPLKDYLHLVYEQTHIVMDYDGIASAKSAKEAIANVNLIINICEKIINNKPKQ